MSHPAIRHKLHYGSRVLPCFAERPPSIAAMLRDAVSHSPDATCIIDGDDAITYRALDAGMMVVVGKLAAIGIRQGDRVAVMLANRREFILAVLACAALGAITVPMNIRQRAPETEYMLGLCGAVLLIHKADTACSRL